MGRFIYTYDLRACNKPIKIETTLKILGVTLDRNLTFKPHIMETLKKGFAKIAALRRIKHFVPTDVMLRLYKAYVLPHFEYCSPILLGIGKPLSRKLESANLYALKTLLNLGSSSDYEGALRLASMRSLEHRRYEQALLTYFKSMKQQGPVYISNLFKLRATRYNLRGGGHNVEQPSYNSHYFHNSFSYIISHVWNQLPLEAKNTSSLTHFRKIINKIIHENKFQSGCRCQHCV